MKSIERKDLRIGYVISYADPAGTRLLHGTIVHLGLGLAARQAVWVRRLEGHKTGEVEGILLKDVTGVIPDAIR